MEENNNKHLIIAGIGIIIIIALAIALPHLKKTVKAPTTDTVAVTTPVVTSAMKSTHPTASADWDAALQKYANRSVTFAADCTASPITQAHKIGTSILLVNDSAVAHTIVVGLNTYTIGAYHYKTTTLTAPNATTAGTVIISCDTQQNAANIGLQQ
jgi:hypothetical protein